MPHKEMIRQLNADLVRVALLEPRAMSKGELADRIGLPLADIARVVDELLAAGELREEHSIPPGDASEPILAYSLNRRASLTLLLRLEETTLHWAVHTLTGGRLDSGYEPCKEGALLKNLRTLAARIRQICPALRYAVLGLPCPVADGKAQAEYASAELRDLDLAAHFREALQLTAVIQSNIRLAAEGHIHQQPSILPETLIFLQRRGGKGLSICRAKADDFTCGHTGLTLTGQIPPLAESLSRCPDTAQAYGAVIEALTVRHKPDRIIFYSDRRLLGMERDILTFCERHLPSEARLELTFPPTFEEDHACGQRIRLRAFHPLPPMITLPIQS